MSKTIIDNRAEPEWTNVIEAKLQLMLGSLLAHISRTEVVLDRTAASGDQPLMYRCKVVLIQDSGEKHSLYNDQADANLAIEGALARARRAMSRLSGTSRPSWQRASKQ